MSDPEYPATLLAEIDAGVLESEHPLANGIMPTITNRRALYVALFLHDVAKGRIEDHSVAGARIARKLGPRLGLTEGQTETAAWLVEQGIDSVSLNPDTVVDTWLYLAEQHKAGSCTEP